jgi:hypothetical protein
VVKFLCSWCDDEAITTVVQMRACRAHHDEYHRRRQAGEEWDSIKQDFYRRRWEKDDAARRAGE